MLRALAGYLALSFTCPMIVHISLLPPSPVLYSEEIDGEDADGKYRLNNFIHWLHTSGHAASWKSSNIHGREQVECGQLPPMDLALIWWFLLPALLLAKPPAPAGIAKLWMACYLSCTEVWLHIPSW